MTAVSRYVLLGPLLLLCLTQAGCLLTYAERGTPVARTRFRTERHARLQPKKSSLDLTLLSQRKPKVHQLGPGDIVNVYIQGILPAGTEAPPIVQASSIAHQNYYPAEGAIRTPSIGIPFEVSPEGTLKLPLLGEVNVKGLTVGEFQKGVATQYVSTGILAENRDRVFISLVKSRTHRVLVIREDSDTPQVVQRNSVSFAKRGRAQTVDLPAYENDVLHALVATGGLPGSDAKNEVWVLRADYEKELDTPLTESEITTASFEPTPERLTQLENNGMAVRLPLLISASEQIEVEPNDVILNDGDIVYVPARNEFFYTSGLLPAGKFPLPRDEDLDVMEAIALAGGSVGGVGGMGGGSVFRSGGLGGIIPPSLVAITRTLPNGKQQLIKVDLAKAMTDPAERILIQPDDVIFLHYRSNELVGNALLNLFNFNFLVSGGVGL